MESDCPFEPNDRVLVPAAYDTFGNTMYSPARVSFVGRDDNDVCFFGIVFPDENDDDDDDDDDDGEADGEADDGSSEADYIEYNPIAYSQENLLRYRPADLNTLLENIDFREASPEMAVQWLKIAVEGRSITAQMALLGHFNETLPLQALGPELLRLAVLPRVIPDARNWWLYNDDDDDDDDDGDRKKPRGWCADYSYTLGWLEERAGAAIVTFPLPENDVLSASSSLEHLAAQRGDIKLLACLLWSDKQREYSRRYSRGEYRLPRDARDKTPLHVAVEHGHIDVIRAYYHGIVQARQDNVVLTGIEEFDAQDSQGRSAVDLAMELDHGKDDMLAALRDLQGAIYQGILNRAMHTFTDGNSVDYDFLQRIALDFNLRVGWVGDEDGVRALFQAAEFGELQRLQWLLLTMKIGSLSSRDPDDDRLSLLHAAARRGEIRRSSMIFRGEREDWDRMAKFEQESCLEQWDGITDIEQYIEKFRSERSQFRLTSSWVDSITEAMEKQPRRVATVLWLAQNGLVLPDCKFLVEECDFETAVSLLRYRLDTEAIVDIWFRDLAPQAMILTKQFLYSGAINVDPKGVALLCVRRFESDPKNECDLHRLKLLQWIVAQYKIDPIDIVDAGGETILHLAAKNGFWLIAIWLAANYRELVYLKGASSGKLPVHVALDSIDTGNRLMCGLLLSFSGEAFFVGGDWVSDERVWMLSDMQGRSIRDYALSCGDNSLRRRAEGPRKKRNHARLLDLIADNNTISEITAFAQRSLLLDYTSSDYGKAELFELAHTSIGFGRLDVLCWLDQNFYGHGYHTLAQSLASSKEHCSLPMVPIVCHPELQLQVDELVEVSCDFRTHVKDVVFRDGTSVSPSVLDGEWSIEHWMPIDDLPVTITVYDLIGKKADTSGLYDCSFKFCDDGKLTVYFENAGCFPANMWTSLHTVTNVSRRVQFQRSVELEGRTPNVFTRPDPTSRVLIMTRTAPLVCPAATWRLARAIESTENEVKVTYVSVYSEAGALGSAFDEWIPKTSTRINWSGVIKTEQRPCLLSPGLTFVSTSTSGRDLAIRCGKQDIVQWIDSADTIAGVVANIRKLDTKFLRKFVSDASSSELQELTLEARNLLEGANLSFDVTTSLESSLHVLDRCWAEEPEPWSVSDLKEERKAYDLRGSGMFNIAVVLGHIGRVQWILDTDRIPQNSPILRKATVKAAQGDRIEIMRELVSRGVDVTTDFTLEPRLTFRTDEAEITLPLIEIALDHLSGEVACYLLDAGLVPDGHLSVSLINKCLTSCWIYGENTNAIAATKAHYRVDLLERLCSLGLRPSNTRNQTDGIDSSMVCFLQTLDRAPMNNGDVVDVPITADALHVLCRFGGDVVTTFNQFHSYNPEFPPSWLTEYVERVVANEDLFRSLLSQEFDLESAELFVAEAGQDLLTLHDRRGRTLLRLAVAAGNADVVKWLIGSKGFDTEEMDLNGQTIRDLCLQLGLGDLVNGVDRISESPP